MMEIIAKIKEIIKTKVRPVLVMDGGNVEFIDYKNNIVTVRLLGACNGCPLSAITLKNVVLEMIRDAVPEVEGIEMADVKEDDDEEF
ncbi:MAG: NifU family protein [Rickettsiales bacterium]|jgi:Fe-S cluster biogenesis protein NfuA|nr:NifU family protein [Rickettsiales bacterium]